ncbi:protein AE7-like 1 [Spinacia oleracea]|uniref:Protein AE7-like 1 n=1 Tax=Spinacia oleracea TaxID=3562 RepID=A0ABM3RMU8_SPIOL|nr:protein AE7-like 1 [Spinacia oleracea]
MTVGLCNANPVVHAKKERVARTEYILPATAVADDDDSSSTVDPLDVYDHVRDIRDPEHSYSLEQLSVLSEDSITVDDNLARILITFTPTIQHCSMATVIGLCLRVKLKHYFPPHYKVDIKVSPGSHADEESVNKQLNDKERIAAALENPNLRQLVDECLSSNEVINFN